jgi:hypothetical protein
MQAYYDVVVNTGGQPVNGASVFVYDAAGALATIYSTPTPVSAEVLDSSGTAYFLSPLLLVPQANPITTGADGRYIFFAENGVYSVVVTASGYNTKTLTVSLNDPDDTPGITYTTYTTSPNNLVNAASLQPKVPTTNGDLILLPKGSGALLRQVPTATSAGGNKRGQYAVDFQTLRASASQVASGNYSALFGGRNNTASGLYGTAIGGETSVASGQSSTAIGGGRASGTNATAIGAGDGSTASGVFSTKIGAGGTTGFQSTVINSYFSGVDGDFCAVVGGSEHSASGTTPGTGFVTIVGGRKNTASAEYATVVGGAWGFDRGVKGIVVASANALPDGVGAVGIAQSATQILYAQTTDATSTRLTCDSASASTNNQLILSNNSAVYFKGSVVANVTGAGNTKSWTFDGQIKRGANAASTVLTGSTTTSPYGDAGASTWTVALAADTTNGGLAVNVAGQASTTIRWVCKIETTEVSY